MSDIVIVALITGIFTTLSGISVAAIGNNATRKVLEVKLEEYHKELIKLEQKQDKHNNVIERMALVEQSVKSAHKRLDEIVEHNDNMS